MDKKTRNMLIAGGVGTLALGPLGAAAVAWAAHALTPEEKDESASNSNTSETSEAKPSYPEKVKAFEIVAPDQIFDPSDIVCWEFFDRGKLMCEFTDYRAFLNMSARLVQGAPFPLEDVFVRFHANEGKSVDVPFPSVASLLFE